MKNLRLIQMVSLTFFILSCSDNDDANSKPLSEEQGISATINGGTFSDYDFFDSIYQVSKNTNNTISIDVSDTNGNQVTLFLNGLGGFDTGTVKNMGDLDSNNFVTYVLIRQVNPEISYYSSSGSLTITENRSHPTASGMRLLSGTFDITASPINDPTTTVMTGTFIDLEYED